MLLSVSTREFISISESNTNILYIIVKNEFIKESNLHYF